MKLSLTRTATCVITAIAALVPHNLYANGRPCKQGLKGGYIIWSKAGSTTGTGAFSFGAGRVSVLPGFV